MPSQEHHQKLEKAALKLRIITWIGAALIAVGVMAAWSYFNRPFDPLRYPTQTVTSRVDGVKGPAVKLGDNLKVEGTTCNVSDKKVELTGKVYWASTVPPGTTVLVGSGVNIREPGCFQYKFSNPMPPEVIREARKLGTNALWRLQGEAAPTHSRGVSKVWRTQPFRIVFND